ncbi:MAG: hypothetical protein HDR00_05500 [Lachnospiraceae bacterium]|nr:hypothetical protein [Lachnospiraceae bacterium]
MNNLRWMPFLPIQELEKIEEQNNKMLKQMFKGRIQGNFMLSIKNRVMKELGLEDLQKYYDFRWSGERMVTGIGEAPEYDICRMIVGIHRAYSIFASYNEIRANEKNEEYRKKIISETIEKIKLRLYGSVYFRKQVFFSEEEFLYYPLPYELFAMCVKINELSQGYDKNDLQLYTGIMYNGVSALMLIEGGLIGNAYPLCRGAIELYLKLLLVSQTKSCEQYEKFRTFEIEQSCTQKYPKEFQRLYEKRSCLNSKNKSDYLHFGWVDSIDGYHEISKKNPYSVYGVITFLKYKESGKISELGDLEYFYRLCHAYTHGSIQRAKYPILHYMEISIMLYHVVCGAFILLCGEKRTEPVINGLDIVAMAERDFEIVCRQYHERSTENFESYYKH